MKEKEKHDVELEQAYNQILELISLTDSLNIPCIIVTSSSTANKEECGIQTDNSTNEPTDSPAPHQTCQPGSTTSMTLKNLKQKPLNHQKEQAYIKQVINIKPILTQKRKLQNQKKLL